MLAEAHQFRARALGVPAPVLDSFRDWHALTNFLLHHALSFALHVRSGPANGPSAITVLAPSSECGGPSSSSFSTSSSSTSRDVSLSSSVPSTAITTTASSASSSSASPSAAPLVQQILRSAEHVGALLTQHRAVELVRSVEAQAAAQAERGGGGSAAAAASALSHLTGQVLRMAINDMRCAPVLMPFSVLDPRALTTRLSDINNIGGNAAVGALRAASAPLLFISGVRGTVVRLTQQLSAPLRTQLENSCNSNNNGSGDDGAAAAAASCLVPLRCSACKNVVNTGFLPDAGAALQRECRIHGGDGPSAHTLRRMNPLYGSIPASLWRIVSSSSSASSSSAICGRKCPACDAAGVRIAVASEACTSVSARMQQVALRCAFPSSGGAVDTIQIVAVGAASLRLGQRVVVAGHYCAETKLMLAHSFDDDDNNANRGDENAIQDAHSLLLPVDELPFASVSIVDAAARIVAPATSQRGGMAAAAPSLHPSAAAPQTCPFDPLLLVLLACSCVWDAASSASAPLVVTLVGPAASGKRALLSHVYRACTGAEQLIAAQGGDVPAAAADALCNFARSCAASGINSSTAGSVTPQARGSASSALPVQSAGIFSLRAPTSARGAPQQQQQRVFAAPSPCLTTSTALFHCGVTPSRDSRAADASLAATTAFPFFDAADYAVPPAAALSVTAPRATLVADGVSNAAVPLLLCFAAASDTDGGGGGASAASRRALHQNLLTTLLARTVPLRVQSLLSANAAAAASSSTAANATLASSAAQISKRSLRQLRVRPQNLAAGNGAPSSSFDAVFSPQDQQLGAVAITGDVHVASPSILIATEHDQASSASPSDSVAAFVSKHLRPVTLFWRLTRGGGGGGGISNGNVACHGCKLPSFAQLLLGARKLLLPNGGVFVPPELTAKLLRGVNEARRAHFHQFQRQGRGGGSGAAPCPVAPLSEYMRLATGLSRAVHALQLALDEFVLAGVEAASTGRHEQLLQHHSGRSASSTAKAVTEDSASIALQILVTALAAPSSAAEPPPSSNRWHSSSSSSSAAAAATPTLDFAAGTRRARAAGGGGGGNGSVAGQVRNLVARVRDVQRGNPTGAVEAAVVEQWFQQCFDAAAARMHLDKAMQQGLLIRTRDGFKALADF